MTPEQDPEVQSYTEAPPEVETEGRSELEGPSPEPSGSASPGSTLAPPAVASTPRPVAFGPAGIFPGDQSPETKNGV